MKELEFCLLSLDAAMEFNETNKFFILEITGWCMKNILFPKASGKSQAIEEDYEVMANEYAIEWSLS
ncbi:39934_t:CDS:2 [Gigaspora margarita]|uniref:39934_t:CDS:1 n=1 Tax=Gigaspora margarita TaxID=4874 RepID=A0ABN7UXI6_GIGMA|nr:39934_t:CDS:2 [Gigaspora margarita]